MVPNSETSRIEHVVVLMLENHSFDHMLGFLKHPNPAFDGLQPGSHHNDGSDAAHIPATDDGVPRGVDPDHSHEGAVRQLGPFRDVPHNGGFVHDYEQRIAALSGKSAEWAKRASAADVMRCLDPTACCPVLSTLALEFALCQRWFSSVPGETWPNRNFAHAATSDSTVNIELGFYWDPTIFELIAKRGRTWRIYYDGTPQVWCFRRLWRTRTIVDFLCRRRPRIGNWFVATEFFRHVEDENLASYSFIEPAHNRYHSPPGHPRQTNSQHPGNNLGDDDDFYAGEQLIKDIYQALLAKPALFAKTLLIIVYDEHGGLFDHAAPDKGVPPGDPVYRGWTRRIGRLLRAFADWRNHQRRKKIYDFSGLGVRVPAVLVSPWIEPATLVTKTFDHASIPATLHKLFAPDMKFLTKRDAVAATFDDVVTGSPLTRPRPNPRDPGGPNHDKTHVGADERTVIPPSHVRPMPDLDMMPELVPQHVAAAPRVENVVLKERPSPEEALVSDELDRELVALAERVHRKLRRTPPALMARARLAIRRTPTPADVARPKVAPKLSPDAHPVDLFEATAETVRRK